MSTNAKASSSGANKAVSGYITFLLYSVTLLACELNLFHVPSLLPEFFSLVVRFVGSSMYMIGE